MTINSTLGPNGWEVSIPAPVSGAAAPATGLAGRVLCDWSTTGGALVVTSAGGGTAALDASTPIDGMPSLKVTLANTAGDVLTARWTPTNPVKVYDLIALQLPMIITANDSTFVADNWACWLNLSSGKQVRMLLKGRGIRPGGAHVYTWTIDESITSVTMSGGGSWAALSVETVTWFQIVGVAAAASTTAGSYPVWCGPVYANRRASKGLVSIRMDGNYESQATLAQPILAQYGIRPTLALVNGNIGQAGSMTAGQIGAMVAGGAQCIHHTYSGAKANGYANATDWPSADSIAEDISLGFQAIRTNGWGGGYEGLMVEGYSGGYSNPVTALVRQRLVAAGMRTAGVEMVSTLDTSSKVQNYAGPKVPGVEIWRTTASISLSSTTVLADVYTQIDQAAREGTWLQILAHVIVGDAATPTGNQIRESDFADVCYYIAIKKATGTLATVTFGEAVALSA